MASVSIAQTHVYISDPAVGTGLTSIARVVVGVSTYNNLSGFGTGYFGDYSWGRVIFLLVQEPKNLRYIIMDYQE